MRTALSRPLILLAAAASVLCCTNNLDVPGPTREAPKKEIAFPVSVQRDGQEIPQGAITKSDGVDTGDRIATMDKSLPFGLVGVDFETGTLLLDNERVAYSGGSYRGFFEKGLWDMPTTVSLSAYYPYVGDLDYGDENRSYSIAFTRADTEAGPLVSKTVECAVDRLNMIPLEFQHITNDIGFKICDVTSICAR